MWQHSESPPQQELELTDTSLNYKRRLRNDAVSSQRRDISNVPSSTRCRPKSLLLDTSIARHRHVTKKLRNLSLILVDRKSDHVIANARTRRGAFLLHDNPLYETEIMNSFANPNYVLCNEDYMNCNSPSAEYCDNGVYIQSSDERDGPNRLFKRFSTMEMRDNHYRGSLMHKSSSLYSSFMTTVTSQSDAAAMQQNDVATSLDKRWPHECDNYHLFDDMCETNDTDEPMEDCYKENFKTIASNGISEPNSDEVTDVNSPDSNDSGIQRDISHSSDKEWGDDTLSSASSSAAKSFQSPTERCLPLGWERHQDDDGDYYWHVHTGIIQREPPTFSVVATPVTPDIAKAFLPGEVMLSNKNCIHHGNQAALQTITETDAKNQGESEPLCTRFHVRSLGWKVVNEDDLSGESNNNHHAVDKCIGDLSAGRKGFGDTVGSWGDGRELLLDVSNEGITLLDASSNQLLHSQPIQSIRVWGARRDNNKDFAYIARDSVSGDHFCHVFRCDGAAQKISAALHNVCQNMALTSGKLSEAECSYPVLPNRPTTLPDLSRVKTTTSSFPTPLEEPKAAINCQYIGCTSVPRPTGMDMLNSAMMRMHSTISPAQWKSVTVCVAPSIISVADSQMPDEILVECRVRFLSFMGIARTNSRLCGFIVDVADSNYVAHIFHCEPSAGMLCKTIEAACKLRYQKCLDARLQQGREMRKTNMPRSKSLSSSLKQGVAALFSGFGRSRKSVEIS